MWNDIKNRKRAFDKVAEELQFDPLYMANWYAIPRKMLTKYKVIKNININIIVLLCVLQYYNIFKKTNFFCRGSLRFWKDINPICGKLLKIFILISFL
jgi:hypothetical protein